MLNCRALIEVCRSDSLNTGKGHVVFYIASPTEKKAYVDLNDAVKRIEVTMTCGFYHHKQLMT